MSLHSTLPMDMRPASPAGRHPVKAADGKRHPEQAQQNHPRRRRKMVRHRPVRCDCGQPAVTVVTVRVGLDPQYTVHLPLCQECLLLEESLRGENN